MATKQDIICVSWNVHRARGNDGQVDPERTVDTLLGEVLPEGAHALALQEADEEAPPHAGLLDLARLERETGLQPVQTEALHRWGPQSHGMLGVIVLMHRSLTVEDVVLLDLPGHHHRGAVVVDAAMQGQSFRLVATHLSLGLPARIAQMRTIGQHLHRRDPRPLVLCGDLNEWRPWGGTALSPRVVGLSLSGPARRSFPVRRPLLPLDRIMASDAAEITGFRVLDGPAIRATSDHRPVMARIRLSG